MDPLTHLLITRALVGKERTTVFAGLAADMPFYATYPVWLIVTGRAHTAFRVDDSPHAPK